MFVTKVAHSASKYAHFSIIKLTKLIREKIIMSECIVFIKPNKVLKKPNY